MRRAAIVPPLLLLALSAAGCAYYNAMWSAERYARDARRLEARGQDIEARTQWSRAALKAESVLVRHPGSRWADDALVLRGEGLARAGACASAAEPIAKALSTVSEAPLRERAGLAAAQCAITNGKPVDAERALAEALASHDGGRRSRAEYLAGQGAASRFAYDAAVTHFQRSREPGAWPARARTLLAAGRPDAAVAVLDTLAGKRFEATEWSELLESLASASNAETASRTLDRMLARGASRVSSTERARLLIADGDRRFARGEFGAAADRYHQAAAAAGAGGDASVARVREVRVVAARAGTRAELAPVGAALERMARPGGAGGAGAGDARALLEVVSRVSATPETPGAAFRAIELARDSLRAPRLAGRLFLDLAAADTASVFAAKALVAALSLLPDQHDSIVTILERVYPVSPYTRAFRGDASPAYAAAEDSLARELGMHAVRGAPPVVARIRAFMLLTGPRGPWLDDPPGGSPAATPTPSRPAPPRARPTREVPVVPRDTL